MAWILDLDGVLWLLEEPIAGAAEAVARLRAGGEDVRFLTNNSSLTAGEYAAKLERVLGVATDPASLLTSAQAAATMIEPGATALVCGGPGVVEALEERGVDVVRDGDADVVVVGWHRDFDFDRMTAATRAIGRGARFVATNDDATYPSPDGPMPGCGAIAASIRTATGVEPEVAGKPNAAMVELCRRRLGDGLPGSTLVGDRPDTDGRFARELGYRWALVLSGVTREVDLPVDPEPDVVAVDLATLVADHQRRPPN